MRRTNAVAVRDRGQPLHVRAQHSAKHLGLGLAQLREIGGHMRDRAMVLAHLHARAGLVRRRGVSIGGQHGGQFSRTPISGHVDQRARIPGFEAIKPLPREGCHRTLATRRPQIEEGGHSDVVVGVPERRLPSVSEREQPGRSTPAAKLAADLALRHLAHLSGRDQRIEVPAHGCGSEPEDRTQCDGALRTMLMQGPGDPIAGAIVVMSGRRTHGSRGLGDRCGFHNDNVTYFAAAPYSGIRRTPTRPYDRSAMAAPTTESAVASTARADARWRPTASTVRRLALASLVANIAIVATGGLVRLTNSGLGCPDWPNCSGGSLVATGKVSWHKAVENTNRGLTGVIMIAVVAVFIAAYRERPARPAVRWWAWVTLLGVPAQAVLGGISVLTDLNPWVVCAHFLLSMALVGAATVLWWNTRTPTPEPSAVPLLVRRLGGATWVLTYAVFAVGTLVTGSGPHAGDAKAVRLPLRPAAISQLHADLVMLLVGVAIGLAVFAAAVGAPPAARTATRVLVGVLAFQAAIGFAQYFAGLPTGLVELHVTGAAVLAAAATATLLALSERSA